MMFLELNSNLYQTEVIESYFARKWVGDFSAGLMAYL